MQNSAQTRITGLSHFLLAIGIFLLSIFAMTGIAYLFVQNGMGLVVDELTQIKIGELSVYESLGLKSFQFIVALAFIVAAFICSKVFRVDFLSFSGLTNKPKILHLGIAFLMLIAIVPIVDGLVRINGALEFPAETQQQLLEMEEKSDNTYGLFLQHNTGIHLFINLLLMSILAAVGEEIFFRGILMRVIANWTKNIHIGIFASALIFAFIHFQPFKILPMVLLAVLFGYLYYRTQSLWVPIILHAINNALVVFADWATKQNIESPMLTEDFVVPTPYILVGVVVLVGLFFILNKNTRSTNFDYE